MAVGAERDVVVEVKIKLTANARVSKTEEKITQQTNLFELPVGLRLDLVIVELCHDIFCSVVV
jgi:hypothetical protein